VITGSRTCSALALALEVSSRVGRRSRGYPETGVWGRGKGWEPESAVPASGGLAKRAERSGTPYVNAIRCNVHECANDIMIWWEYKIRKPETDEEYFRGTTELVQRPSRISSSVHSVAGMKIRDHIVCAFGNY
jgi:hypothetical protein